MVFKAISSVFREVILIKIFKYTIMILTILSANIFIESPIRTEAANVNPPSSSLYTANQLSLREEGLEIKGEYPIVQNLNNLGSVLNGSIYDTYRQKVADAKESKARSITFEWKAYASPYGIYSIILKSKITTAVSKDEVNSFNFIPSQSRLVGVNDILGPNGLQIADKVISQRIRADSEHYYTNFPGLQDTDAFYVTNDGNIVFLFDAFQIAPGSVGITSFQLKINGVINTGPIKKDEGYWIKDTSYSLKMVPLRAIAESLGYRINLNNDYNIVTVSRSGDVTVSFMIGENSYMSSRPDAPGKNQTRALESAPEKKNGITYVPISFFDQILELVAYRVDENDSIIFSTYID